jgi:hypothetical protein
MAQFTTIDHETRRKFNLTLNEYAICDSVYHLSREQLCTMSKENLGIFIGVSKQSVHHILNTLEEKKLIERQNKYGLKTTEKWNKEMKSQHGDSKESLPLEKDSKESLPHSKESLPEMVKKVYLDGKESLHNIDNKDIDNNNNKYNNVENEIYNLILKGFNDYHNNQYVTPKKEFIIARNISKRLMKIDNWQEVLQNKINGLYNKVKKDKNGFWSFTISKLQYGWNEFENTKQQSIDQTDKIFNHLQEKMKS